MNYHVKAVKVSSDTISFTLEVRRPHPVPTRTKYRMRRLLRVVRKAAFHAARSDIGRPLLTQHVIQVCRDTAKRYAHLRT